MSDTRPGPAPVNVAKKMMVFGACAGIGALVGTLAWPEPPVRAAQAAEIRLAGARVEPAADWEQVALMHAQRYLSGPMTLRAGDATLTLRRADLGVQVDLDHLHELLEQAADARSPLRRAHQQVLGQRPIGLPMPSALEAARALPHLLRLKDRIDAAPVDAHVDPREKRAVPARPGVTLDLHASLERIDRALLDGHSEVTLATLEVPAKRSIERFEAVDMRSVLSEFSTRYARGAHALDRTHNLRIAAAKLDGYVLAPGATLDFNAVVGDRTQLGGFKVAPVIAGGVLSDGMGGGTCQIASTLHAAAFFAGMAMLERHPHSRPSFYIKLGLDAAVAYGSLNFKFKNNRDYPIVIEMTVDQGFVRAALHGPERTHTVSLLRRIDATTPFDEQVIEDAALPKGLRVLQQRGIPGFELTRMRVVHDERTQVSTREKSTDRYPATTEIWRVGTGGEPGPEFIHPENDAHPEYVADEYMKATAGPGIDGIEVDAKPGRTGSYGWTEREGMRKGAPKTDADSAT